MNCRFHVANAAQTLALGRALAAALPDEAPFQCVLMEGELGAGKTTLVRGLVESLPGGAEAEVASPSFNLVNIYPTQPETAHVDLYRCEGAPLDDSLLELLAEGNRLVLIEWSQFLDNTFQPDDAVHVHITVADAGRDITFSATGTGATAYLAAISHIALSFITAA